MRFLEFVSVQFFVNFFQFRRLEFAVFPALKLTKIGTANHAIGFGKFLKLMFNFFSEKFSTDNLIIEFYILSYTGLCFCERSVERMQYFGQIAAFLLSQFRGNSVDP